MMNSVILIGRLTRDPDSGTAGGYARCRFTLAVDRPYTNQQGDREADFIDVVAWRALAEVCGRHLAKGRLVAVRGRLQVRSYETEDGSRRRVAEVVAEDVRFLDKPRDRQGESEQPPTADLGEIDDDEVPF